MPDVTRSFGYELEWVTCSPAPRSTTAGCGQSRATSGRATTKALAPEHGITISSRRRGSTTSGDDSTSSRVIGWPKKRALGLAQALVRWSTATLARCSSVVPNSWAWRMAMRA